MKSKNQSITSRNTDVVRKPALETKSILQSLSPEQRIRLREVLAGVFMFDELRTLCFDLSIDYDDIVPFGSEKSRAVVAILTYCDDRERLPELIYAIQRARPNIFQDDAELNYFAKNRTAKTIDIYEWNTPEESTLEFIAEVKLMLIGDGNVGKTSLVNQLIYGTFNNDEDTTRGIAINHWMLNIKHETLSTVRMNIWDFGGQGSMHATHPYFFSRRAIYLLVLNVREDDRFNRVDYWLRMIRAFGGDSKIIVVANKMEQFTAKLDEAALMERYPNIVNFLRTSCADGRGISELRECIANIVSGFEEIGVRTPQPMILAKKEIERLCDPTQPDTKDILGLSEYTSLCETYGVGDEQQTFLLRRLHELGVALYFGDDIRLGINVVLNPIWVTQGIYAIINHESVAHADGKLQAGRIQDILPQNRYPADKTLYILNIMMKFELCFPLDEQGNWYLLPDLLPAQQPILSDFDRPNALGLNCEYIIWQGTILTRLIVRLNHYLVENVYWRNGALFRSSDGKNRALVIANDADRRLRIWVDGAMETRRSFLNRIREELDVIHGNQREQSVKELVVTKQGGEVPYRLLIGLEERKVEKHALLVGNDFEEVDVKELLEGVRADVIPDPRRLKELMMERFSLDNLDTLCFELGIGLEDIEGDMTVESKSRELIRQFERTRKMPELMAALRKARKNMPWV